jgi:hypothetical protein
MTSLHSLTSLEDTCPTPLYRTFYLLKFANNKFLDVPFHIVQNAHFFKSFRAYTLAFSEPTEAEIIRRVVDLTDWKLDTFQTIFLYMQKKAYIHLETLDRTKLNQIEQLADYIRFNPLLVTHFMIRLEWKDTLGKWGIRMCSHMPYLQGTAFNPRDPQYEINSNNSDIRSFDENKVFISDVYCKSLKIANDLVQRTEMSVSKLKLVGQNINDWTLDINLVSDGLMSVPCILYSNLLQGSPEDTFRKLSFLLLSPTIECIDARIFRKTKTYRRGMSNTMDRHRFPEVVE